MANPSPGSAAYNSNAVPFGGRFVYIYRTPASPVQIGLYLVESFSPASAAVVVDRPTEIGGDNGFAIVDGKKEGSIKVQLNVTNTPTLLNGDFFKTSKATYDASGNAVTEIYVLTNMAEAIGTTEYLSQSGTGRQDKFPSAAVLAIAEF